MHLGEFALNLKQQTCQCVGIALNLLKDVVVQFQNLVEVTQQRLALKDKGVAVDADVALLVIIVLIVDFAYDFLQNILQRHNAAGTTKLVHHNGNMHLVLLELA